MVEKMSEKYKSDKRAVGIIIKDDKILLIRRIREGVEYFVFPGGGVEEGETVEEATIREVQEELCLNAEINKFLFKIFNPAKIKHFDGRDDYFYLITEFSGEPKLGGPEKERMNEKDQYYPEWHDLKKALDYENLYPKEARKKLSGLFNE